jgi:hypothetical protein
MVESDLPGSATLSLVSNVVPLDFEPAVFAAMLSGWADQQRARFLRPPTIQPREGIIRRFADFIGEYPWRAFADTIGAVCAVVNLPPGAGTSTIESKTNFFRAVRGGVVTATCTPLQVGRTTIVAQINLSDARGRLVAQVTQTQAVLGAPGIDGKAQQLHQA